MGQCPSLEGRPESGRGHREDRTNTDGAKLHPTPPPRNPFPVEQSSYKKAEKTRQLAFLQERGLGLWEGREHAGTGPLLDGPQTDSPAGPPGRTGRAGGAPSLCQQQDAPEKGDLSGPALPSRCPRQVALPSVSASEKQRSQFEVLPASSKSETSMDRVEQQAHAGIPAPGEGALSLPGGGGAEVGSRFTRTWPLLL